jgi:hypothetical protein
MRKTNSPCEKKKEGDCRSLRQHTAYQNEWSKKGSDQKWENERALQVQAVQPGLPPYSTEPNVALYKQICIRLCMSVLIPSNTVIF